MVNEMEYERVPVYTGELINDGLRMTPEQQKEMILNEARRNGVTIENPDDYEIGFTGVSEIGDALSTPYVIYQRVPKAIEEFTANEGLRDNMVSVSYTHLRAHET